MAFSADELRVLKCALSYVTQPALVPDHEVRACRRLVRAVDETVDEAVRQRAFLVADLERYRDALPGAASGYLERLQRAISLGWYAPTEVDLEALSHLCAESTGSSDRHTAARRALLLVRATLPGPAEPTRARELPALAELGELTEIARRLDEPEEPGKSDKPDEPATPPSSVEKSSVENRSEMSDKSEPRRRPVDPKAPTAPRPDGPEPTRPAKPMPTPAEVFPPRRRPTSPNEGLTPPALLT